MRKSAVPLLAGFFLAVAVSIPSSVAAQAPHLVTMPSEDFSPYHLEIEPGETVVWRNTGGQGHDVTSFDGLFASSVLANGDSFSFTFTSPGTYGYYCTIHPSTMTAEVVVAGVSGPSPTPVPPEATSSPPLPAERPATAPAAPVSTQSAAAVTPVLARSPSPQPTTATAPTPTPTQATTPPPIASAGIAPTTTTTAALGAAPAEPPAANEEDPCRGSLVTLSAGLGARCYLRLPRSW
ncbi:MAG: plastocyanin/azurin family copper-binding protein [Dehalococcoidia bacterium]